MQRSYRTVLICLAPLATATYASLWLLNVGPEIASIDAAGLLTFAFIAFLAEAAAIDFRLTAGQRIQSSLAFLPFIASVLLFPPAVSVTAIAAVVALSQLVLRRNPRLRAGSNVMMAVLGSSLAGLVYHSIANAPQFSVIGFAAAAVTFFGVNVFLATAALSYLHSQSMGVMFRRVTGPNGSNLTYDIFASPIAAVLVLLYNSAGFWGPLAFLLPLVLLSYSYRSRKEAVDASKDLLRALVKAIETRDPYTEGHSVRVATLAKAVAYDMGLRYRALEHVETSALLHDIGKVDPVYAAVLAKPHNLSPDERQLIQTHAERGAELLETTLTSLQPEVIAAVRHHHERYDGKGYPNGIAGKTIPLAARIIMLCDSVDAMLSDRPYRKALTVQHVRKELMTNSGTQFDPEIVEVILKKNTLERAVDLIKKDAHTQRAGVAVMN